jgi:hypothetical protein
MNISPTEIVRLYRVWTSMMYRCHNPKNQQYKNYGARGIHVCNEWHDFDQFVFDVGIRPNDAYELDRTNNDLGYFKENCKWVSIKENARNRRNNHYYYTHLGKMCQSQLIEHIGYTRKQFQRAIEKYGIEKFLTMFKENQLPKKRIVADITEIVGKKFGNLTVLKLCEDKSCGIKYFCKCDCGKETFTYRHRLLHNMIFSCKYCKIKKNKEKKLENIYKKIKSQITNNKIKISDTQSFNKDDFIGKKFNKWTVLSFAKYIKGRGNIYLCKCECGIEKEVAGYNLRVEKSKQCRSCAYDQQINKPNSKRWKKNKQTNFERYGIENILNEYESNRNSTS